MALVRDFSRFYTKRIGLLQEGLLGTPYSLTEARLLFELGPRPGIRWSDLVEALDLDPGYLSRLLSGLQRQGLLKRAKSRTDRRVSHLMLTAKGRKAFKDLNQRSEAEITAMLANLAPAQRQQLAESMAAIRRLLAPDASEGAFCLRSHQPGDIGWVIARHGEIYAREYEWDATFEGLVASIAGHFLTHLDGHRERCWIAERSGERLGCIFLVKGSKTAAKLRMLLVEPSARGMGVGTALVRACLDFARLAGYRKITLWTNDILRDARRIYERAGFRLVKEEKHHSFGHDLVGQFWELKLQRAAAQPQSERA